MYNKSCKVMTCDTYVFDIFIAGDLKEAKKICQAYVDKVGLCVSVTENDYIYSLGSESGVRVTLINYPRFATLKGLLEEKAFDLGHELLLGLGQGSFTVVGPDCSYFVTRRKGD